jgi:Raf kinase inhibitor-like YbhB/YbcL family protein
MRPRPNCRSLLTPTSLSLALSLFLAGCRSDSHADVPESMRRIAMELPQADGPLNLHVRSDAFEEGREIPDEYSADGRNVSPSLAWSGVPAGAQSIVVIVEDPDAPPPQTPFVHWLVYAIPPTVERLPQGIPKVKQPEQPAGIAQGLNSSGSIGWFGPKPPKGDPPHHYHFQVFALDRNLKLEPGANRQQVLQAMSGHVVGKGQVLGLFHE